MRQVFWGFIVFALTLSGCTTLPPVSETVVQLMFTPVGDPPIPTVIAITDEGEIFLGNSRRANYCGSFENQKFAEFQRYAGEFIVADDYKLSESQWALAKIQLFYAGKHRVFVKEFPPMGYAELIGFISPFLSRCGNQEADLFLVQSEDEE